MVLPIVMIVPPWTGGPAGVAFMMLTAAVVGWAIEPVVALTAEVAAVIASVELVIPPRTTPLSMAHRRLRASRLQTARRALAPSSRKLQGGTMRTAGV